MNFKQFQFLKGRTIEKLKEQVQMLPNDASALARYDSLSLAYIGDAYYSLYIRRAVLETGITKVRVIHDIVTAIICAKMQAQCFLKMEALFTEAEREVGHRARNSQVNVPKSAEPWEYRCSTAFEAILGYVYCTNDEARLTRLCQHALMTALSEM